MTSQRHRASRHLSPVVAAVLGLVVGMVLSDIGLGIVFATLAGFGSLLYSRSRSDQES